MFQEFYGFVAMPFSRGVATAKLFLAGAQEELKARLAYLVRERGIGLITGEIGSGKSTAVRSFVDGLDPTRHTVVYTANPLIGITGFYREVLLQLGEPVPMFRQQMVLGIRRAFDLLTNERMNSQAAAALVLVGHSELRRTLRLSIHEAFWQRTSVRFHLRALDLTETGAYIRHQVEVAGYRGTALFSDGFVAKAYDYTKGIPRQINLVCTHALMAGCGDQKQILDETVLRQVINDLETANTQ